MPFLKVRVVLRETLRTARTPKRPPGRHLHRRQARDMAHQKIHSDVLAVHVLVHLVPDRLRQPLPVQVQIVPVQERRPRQHHAQLATVVRVIQPAALGVHVPGVVPAREAHDPLPVLAPHPEPEKDLVVSEVRVIVHRQDGLGLEVVERQEPIVEGIPGRFDHVHGSSDVGPLQLGAGGARGVPDDHHRIKVG